MKFGLSRGGSSEAANRRSRESGLRDLEKGERAKKRAAVKQLREALRVATRDARQGCKQKRKDTYLMAAEGHREVRYELAEDLAKLKGSCAIRIASAIGPLRASIEEIASELRTSALARRHSAARARERPKVSTKESREEQIEKALRDVEAMDPALVSLLKKEGRAIVAKPRQTLGEAYLEWIAENPERVREHQAKASHVGQADMMCAQALNDSKMGSPEAREWAAKHCTEEGAATPKFRHKTSAASRTLGLFGPHGPKPKPETPAAKERTLSKGKKAPRGQQGLSVGKFGASFLDANPDQVPF